MAIGRRRARRLFVTGGGGFLGRHVVNGPASESWEVVAPGSRSVDLRDRDALMAMVRDWKPTAIVHTAYRRDERASIVDASRHVAEAALAVRARLVHVSSDALFSGQIARYAEADPPRPLHDYGLAKADAESEVTALDPSAALVRTSLIYSDGTGRDMSVHETAVRDAISGQSPMTFFTDEYRSPVLVGDLAAALVEIAGRPAITGLLHLGGPEPLSRAALATLVANHYGWEAARLQFSTLEEAGLSRPSKVVLDSSLAARWGIAVGGPSDWASG